MAVRFSDEQVVNAMGAHRLKPGGAASYTNVCTDTRALTPGCLFVALKGERFDAHDFLDKAALAQAAGAVVEAGHPLPPLPEGFALYAVPDTLKALGALAQAHRRQFKLPVGAVGGSNGKTTTKEMVAAILEVRGPSLRTEGNLNNEVGAPLTLFRLDPSHVAAVVELGMNRAGEMARLTQMTLPDAAVITVIQPEHLEGLGSLQGVAEAEGELFENLPAHAVAVVNLDEPLIVAQAQKSRARRLTFGRAADAQIRLVKVAVRGKAGLTAHIQDEGVTREIPLRFVGEHNAFNATAAYALARAMGFSAEECVRGLSQAQPYSRRLNVVEGPGGVVVLDDCYNANPASMAAALETARSLGEGGKTVAVLGDMLELGPGELSAHRELGALAAEKVDAVAFFGPRSLEGFKAASALGNQAAHFTEVAPLLAWIQSKLSAKDVVLVKGSRGMRLERVVSGLLGQAAAEGAH